MFGGALTDFTKATLGYPPKQQRSLTLPRIYWSDLNENIENIDPLDCQLGGGGEGGHEKATIDN